MTTSATVRVAGPYFEELERGQVERGAPALTLTDGHAAVHQAILGGRLRLALDAPLARRVCGGERPLAHPALVCDVAIGQSTLLTQRVIANLFYRGLVLRRLPRIGDTLRTTTEVVALKQNRARPDRPATGLAVLRIVTVDQDERPVLDFTRCAMLPLRDARRRDRPRGRDRGRAARLRRGGARRARRAAGTSPRMRPATGFGALAEGTRFARRGRRRGERGAGARPAQPQRRDGAPRPRAPGRAGAGSSTAATRSASPPRS